MLSKITVYGRLARFLGQRTFEAEINSSVDAIRFLLANFPKLQSHMIEQNYCVKIGNYEINEKELDVPVGQQEIKIVPVAIGARKGLGRFILGAALIGVAVFNPAVGMGLGGGLGFSTASGAFSLAALAGNIGIYLALSGASEMISPTPKPPGISDDPQQRNFSFNGVQNTGRAGVAIPVVYGEIFTGSLVVSAGIDTEDIL